MPARMTFTSLLPSPPSSSSAIDPFCSRCSARRSSSTIDPATSGFEPEPTTCPPYTVTTFTGSCPTRTSVAVRTVTQSWYSVLSQCTATVSVTITAPGLTIRETIFQATPTPVVSSIPIADSSQAVPTSSFPLPSLPDLGAFSTVSLRINIPTIGVSTSSAPAGVPSPTSPLSSDPTPSSSSPSESIVATLSTSNFYETTPPGAPSGPSGTTTLALTSSTPLTSASLGPPIGLQPSDPSSGSATPCSTCLGSLTTPATSVCLTCGPPVTTSSSPGSPSLSASTISLISNSASVPTSSGPSQLPTPSAPISDPGAPSTAIPAVTTSSVPSDPCPGRSVVCPECPGGYSCPESTLTAPSTSSPIVPGGSSSIPTPPESATTSPASDPSVTPASSSAVPDPLEPSGPYICPNGDFVSDFNSCYGPPSTTQPSTLPTFPALSSASLPSSAQQSTTQVLVRCSDGTYAPFAKDCPSDVTQTPVLTSKGPPVASTETSQSLLPSSSSTGIASSTPSITSGSSFSTSPTAPAGGPSSATTSPSPAVSGCIPNPNGSVAPGCSTSSLSSSQISTLPASQSSSPVTSPSVTDPGCSLDSYGSRAPGCPTNVNSEPQLPTAPAASTEVQVVTVTRTRCAATGTLGADGTCTSRHQTTPVSTDSLTGSLTTGSLTTAGTSNGGELTGSKTTDSLVTGSVITGSQTTGLQTTGSLTTGPSTTGSRTTGSTSNGAESIGSKNTDSLGTGSLITGSQTTGLQTTGLQSTGSVTTGLQTTAVTSISAGTTSSVTTGSLATDSLTAPTPTTGPQMYGSLTTDSLAQSSQPTQSGEPTLTPDFLPSGAGVSSRGSLARISSDSPATSSAPSSIISSSSANGPGVFTDPVVATTPSLTSVLTPTPTSAISATDPSESVGYAPRRTYQKRSGRMWPRLG
ncbi:MAG: 40S ribosomal protein [Watsoniomyces obsoletus]|nr:MAG: 40S ribosomal protein [Watsoniomyces obsoletus]